MRAIAGVVALLLAQDVCAQTYSGETPLEPVAAGQTQPPPRLSAEQLDQLLAPIALYPDALLAQVLMASTYPLEIVEADRWVRDNQNAALSGAALDEALKSQPWDPSVKSLVPFPQILRMLDDHLNWTEQVGDTFLADRAAVMDSVQRLRHQAEAAGNLKSTPYQTVSPQGSVIVIEQPNPDILYVPVYDPTVMYGPWPYPDYPPYYFPGYFNVVVAGGIGFGWFGFGIDLPLCCWGFWDWPRHRVFVDRRRFNEINFRHRPIDDDTWHHDPEHRHGVPYRDERTRARFQPQERSPEERRNFRGFPPGEQRRQLQGTPPLVQPLPQVVHPLPQVVQPLPQVVRPLPAQPRAENAQPRAGDTQPRREDGQRDGMGRDGMEREHRFESERGAPPRQFSAPPQAYRPPAPQVYRAPSPPPAFESFGRGNQVRSESQRGYASRHSQPQAGGGPRVQQPVPAQGGRGFRRLDH